MMEDESLHQSFDLIQAATNCFSQDNKIGEGGFGDVYQVTSVNMFFSQSWTLG